MELFTGYKNLCEIPARSAWLFPERISHKWRGTNGFTTRTCTDFFNDICALAAGFEAYGVKKETHTAFFVDNRYEWAVTDFALMAIGAISVPRGSDTAPKEQKFIYTHSDSKFLVMDNTAGLAALMAEFSHDEIKRIDRIFIMDDAPTSEFSELIAGKIVFYKTLLAKGRETLRYEPKYYERITGLINANDTVTIIYTSGTSGNPKGVMLSHANFLHQVRAITPLLWIDLKKGDKTVSILPSWHVYERAYEYCTAAGAVTVIYSGIRNFAEDLKSEKPELVCSVPRVWESIYEKMNAKMEQSPPAKRLIFNFFLAVAKAYHTAKNFSLGYFVAYKKQDFSRFILNRLLMIFLFPAYAVSQKIFAPIRELMGGNLRASISGGGSLAPHIDLSFNAMGIRLVNAFGMTETSPGTITRRLDRNTLGSIGIPLAETEAKILKENGWPASTGEKGIIYVRGPQVMKGYYKNPEATKEVLSEDGWLNTGDIGTSSVSGDYVMTGRAKSTIVLLGGENLEPEPIEEKLKESALIDHAVVMGQDKKSPVALLTISEEKLKHMADKMKISWDDLMHKGSDIIHHNKILKEVNREVAKLISRANGFRPFEKISKFVLIKKKFSIGDELTQTLKVKRQHVEKKYKHLF